MTSNMTSNSYHYPSPSFRARLTCAQLRPIPLLFFLSLLLLSLTPLSPQAASATPQAGQDLRSTLVIYGATPGGIMAAVAAAREGVKVTLVEPTKHVGGLTTSGLGGTDHCVKRVIGGLSREFFYRNGAAYGRSGAEWRTESGRAEKIFEGYLQEANVELLRETKVLALNKQGAKIISAALSSGKTLPADAFIDATYEGDLLPLAGVSYHVGRESAQEFAETTAGIFHTNVRDQFPASVSGRLQSGPQKGALLPGILPSGPGTRGSADSKLPAFNYRPCITKEASNRVEFRKPAHFDPLQYELLVQYLQAQPQVRIDELFRFLPTPGNKIDLNNRGPFSSNFIGQSWEYPEASEAKREQIRQAHRTYLEGLLYFVANDPRIPPHIQGEWRQYGLCKDEFVSNQHWPYQLYVRVGRRLRGQYVLREKDLTHERSKEDVIANASCPVESHHAQRYLAQDGTIKHEGWVTIMVKPYHIPLRSIVPKASEASNLLVPVALSASHIAYSSLRMEPTFMILGQSAGVAAAQALSRKVTMQEIDYPQLREKLSKQKQRLGIF
jgi:hypothetical protein